MAQIYLSLHDDFPKIDMPEALWAFLATCLSLSSIAIMWLCIRMFSDFAYFWAVWRPRNKM